MNILERLTQTLRFEVIFLIVFSLDSILTIFNFIDVLFDDSYISSVSDFISQVQLRQIYLSFCNLILYAIIVWLKFLLIKVASSTKVKLSPRQLHNMITANFVIQIIMYLLSMPENQQYFVLTNCIKIAISITYISIQNNQNIRLINGIVAIIMILAQILLFDSFLIPRIQLILLLVIIPFICLKTNQLKQQTAKPHDCNLEQISSKKELFPQRVVDSFHHREDYQPNSRNSLKEAKKSKKLVNFQHSLMNVSNQCNSFNELKQSITLNNNSSAHNQINLNVGSIRSKTYKLTKFYTTQDLNFKKQKKLQFFLSLIDELPEGVLLINQKLSCINMNKKCLQLFKLKDENLATDLVLNLTNITLRNDNEINIKSQFSTLYLSKSTFILPGEQKFREDIPKQFDQQSIFRRPSKYNKHHLESIKSEDNNNLINISPKNNSQQFATYKSEQYLDQPKMSEIFRTHKIPLSSSKNVKDQVNFLFQEQMQNTENQFANRIFSEQKVQMLCQLGSQHNDRSKILQIIFIPCAFKKQFCVLCIIRNITYIQRIDLLQQLNENKTQMLSQVAHEIRTPLNCIINMLEISAQCQSIDKIKLYITPSLSSAKLLSNLIHDLLDIAQQKAGTFQLNMSKFNLKLLLSDIKDLMNIQAISQGIKLNIDYNRTVQETIISDQYRLRQIIINLLGNSFKYTKQGSVTITVNNYQNDYQVLEIKIRDTGIGIKSENLDKLFKAFSKLESDKDRQLNPQGVGLGLMISNMLVKSLEPENLNRGLAVKSEVGQGTEFSFLIKDHNLELQFINEEVNQEDEQQSQQSVHNYQNEGKIRQMNARLKDFTSMKTIDNLINSDFLKNEDLIQSQHSIKDTVKSGLECKCCPILIVDDEQFNIFTLKQMLSFYNINSEVAQSGQECEAKCLERLQSSCCKAYSIIFIDFDMPEQDGIQTSKNLINLFKNNLINSNIIGCTGYSDSQSRQNGLDSGMKEVIMKPLKSSELKAILNNYYLNEKPNQLQMFQ